MSLAYKNRRKSNLFDALIPKKHSEPGTIVPSSPQFELILPTGVDSAGFPRLREVDQDVGAGATVAVVGVDVGSAVQEVVTVLAEDRVSAG